MGSAMKACGALLLVLATRPALATWEVRYEFDGEQHAAGLYVDELGCDYAYPSMGHSPSGTFVYWEIYTQSEQYRSEPPPPGNHAFGISSHVGWNERDPGDTSLTYGPRDETSSGGVTLHADKTGVITITNWANPTGGVLNGSIRFRCLDK